MRCTPSMTGRSWWFQVSTVRRGKNEMHTQCWTPNSCCNHMKMTPNLTPTNLTAQTHNRITSVDFAELINFCAGYDHRIKYKSRPPHAQKKYGQAACILRLIILLPSEADNCIRLPLLILFLSSPPCDGKRKNLCKGNVVHDYL